MAETICDTKSFTIALAEPVAELNMIFFHIWRTPPPIPEGGSDWIGVDVHNNTNHVEVEFKLRLLDENNNEIDDWPEFRWYPVNPGKGLRVGTESHHEPMACLHMKNMLARDVSVKVELCVRKKGFL